MRPVLLLVALAGPTAAEGLDPAAVEPTPQVMRLLAAGPERATQILLDLMARIGRADGIVLENLTADRDAADAERIDEAIQALLALDTGDGVLTRLEVSRAQRDWTAQHLQTFFEEFDSDGDGRVDPAEVETGVRVRAQEVGSTEILEDLREWDLDGDGTVDADEVRAVVLANPRAGDVGMTLPPYHFRSREGGAAVFRVETETRDRRLSLRQIATVNLGNGRVRAQGATELTDADHAAIEAWLAAQRARRDALDAETPTRALEALGAAAHWAQARAEPEALEAATDALLLAMHDLRSVLVRKRADRLARDGDG